MPTSRPCRRIVLDAVSRRDAAQRLNLALCLLLREPPDRFSLAVTIPETDPLPSPSHPTSKEDEPS